MISAVSRSTTTTAAPVERIVGDPLSGWVLLAAGFALLVVILVAGFVTQRRLASKSSSTT